MYHEKERPLASPNQSWLEKASFKNPCFYGLFLCQKLTCLKLKRDRAIYCLLTIHSFKRNVVIELCFSFFVNIRIKKHVSYWQKKSITDFILSERHFKSVYKLRTSKVDRSLYARKKTIYKKHRARFKSLAKRQTTNTFYDRVDDNRSVIIDERNTASVLK